MTKSLMETNEKYDYATVDKTAKNVTAPEDLTWIIRQYEKIIKLQKNRPTTLCLGPDTCLKRSRKLIFFFSFFFFWHDRLKKTYLIIILHNLIK